jgi:hypothetical protein
MGAILFLLSDQDKMRNLCSQNDLLVDLNKVYEVFHRMSLFSMDPVKNIAVMGNSCF